MKKFDCYKWFLFEQEDEEMVQQNIDQNNPVLGQQGQTAPAAPNAQNPQTDATGTEQTPQQMNQQQVETPFDQFTGATIKNMSFKPHENGGSIVIHTSLSPLPVIISWSGDRVTVKHKGVTALT